MSVRLITDSRRSSPALTPSAALSAQSRRLLLQGLMSQTASLPCSCLYDALGARLFAAITELPEYYLTRTEANLLSRHQAEISVLANSVHTLVDLGAGDCKKAMQLLHLLHPHVYLAVDVSRECVVDGANSIARDFPDLSVVAYVTDFSSGMQWPHELPLERPLFFYPGSSLGNFSPQDAQNFLRSLAGTGEPATDTRLLLIGVDLIKPVQVLEAAYADALGVTACFNLNSLNHVNRIAGTDFNVGRFRHRAVFNDTHSRMEMSLVSQCAQTVRWAGGERHFDEGEPIITEHSYKYTIPGFGKLLQSSGFEIVRHWTDEHETYLLCAARSVR